MHSHFALDAGTKKKKKKQKLPPPIRATPVNSQPSGAECWGTSRALSGGERPTRIPSVEAITYNNSKK
jgi:hypothetical protein